MQLPYDPEIPPLQINAKNPETLIQKNICILIFHCSYIYNSQYLEVSHVPIIR